MRRAVSKTRGELLMCSIATRACFALCIGELESTVPLRGTAQYFNHKSDTSILFHRKGQVTSIATIYPCLKVKRL